MDKNHIRQDTDLLLQRLASADENAFKEIYNLYGRKVYQTAFRYLRSRETALDIVQDIFFSLWEKRDQFLHVNSLEGYLIKTTQHHIYALLKKWASESQRETEYSNSVEDFVDDADFQVRSQQYEDLINQLVELLPPQQKLVFTMSRNKGMSHEAIAHELNLSQGTVKHHIVKALQFLRKHLAPHVSFYLLLLS